MLTRRIRKIAAVVLACGMALGGGRLASSQFGGLVSSGHGPGSDESASSSLGTNLSVAVETPEKDGLKVYSIDAGTWTEYRAPKGTRVRPIVFPGLLATMPEGPKITQLAVYIESDRVWDTQDLREPANGKLVPTVRSGMAVYVVGPRVYAYGVEGGRWDVLELPEGAKPEPIVGARIATVRHGDRLYIFNTVFGRWDDSGQPAK